jgi:hypothetical protein
VRFRRTLLGWYVRFMEELPFGCPSLGATREKTADLPSAATKLTYHHRPPEKSIRPRGTGTAPPGPSGGFAKTRATTRREVRRRVLPQSTSGLSSRDMRSTTTCRADFPS